MFDSETVLKNEERAIFRLRSLYRSYGYSQYKVSKFEEYDLYARNKNFLVSESILTFTDTNGRLMALKPDVTLSIIKNTREQDAPLQKLYYNENVYRVSHSTHGFREIMQTGLECIGDIDLYSVGEVVMLAARSLELISSRYILDLSHMGVVSGLLEELGLDTRTAAQLLRCMSDKNLQGLKSLCAELGLGDGAFETLKALATVYGPAEQALEQVRRIPLGETAARALAELEQIAGLLKAYGVLDHIYLDFSIVNDMNYYSGVIFRGFIDGIPTGVLSGGRYDHLLHRMGKQAGAIGFAVYLDQLERFGERERPYDVDVLLLYEPGVPETRIIETVQRLVAQGQTVKVQKTDPGGVRCRQLLRITREGRNSLKTMIDIALPKGRLGEQVYDIFERAGYACPSIRESNRKLIFESRENGVRYFWVKPSDVAIYVERGAADIGVAGRDILMEYEPEVYELLDLGVGKCRMAVAGPKGFRDSREHTLRVATKFPNIAREHYGRQSREIDIIKLNGSIELAPILKLSDVIVDIVETGKTLLENNLEPYETIVDISARLIANKVSYKFKNEAVRELCDRVAVVCGVQL